MSLDSTRDVAPARRPTTKHAGGRPTATESQKLHERLLDTAGDLFIKNGFDGTSMDAVADAAHMSKRTVYARYRDKSDLFRAVLCRLIERWLVPIDSFETKLAKLEPTLLELGNHLLASALTPQSLSLHRIIVAESERHPEIAGLAQAGREAGIRAIARLLARHRDELRIADLDRAADLFMSLVVDSARRRAMFEADPAEVEFPQRLRFAVDVFLNGARRTTSKPAST